MQISLLSFVTLALVGASALAVPVAIGGDQTITSTGMVQKRTTLADGPSEGTQPSDFQEFVPSSKAPFGKGPDKAPIQDAGSVKAPPHKPGNTEHPSGRPKGSKSGSGASLDPTTGPSPPPKDHKCAKGKGKGCKGGDKKRVTKGFAASAEADAQAKGQAEAKGDLPGKEFEFSEAGEFSEHKEAQISVNERGFGFGKRHEHGPHKDKDEMKEGKEGHHDDEHDHHHDDQKDDHHDDKHDDHHDQKDDSHDDKKDDRHDDEHDHRDDKHDDHHDEKHDDHHDEKHDDHRDDKHDDRKDKGPDPHKEDKDHDKEKGHKEDGKPEKPVTTGSS